MPDLPPETSRWFAEHHGVITTDTLRLHGVSRSTRRRLVEAEVLRRPARGVYVAAAAPRTLEQRCAELSAIHPAGFVTGPTAGVLGRLRRMPSSAALHFSVPHGLHLLDEAGVLWRQTTVIDPVDRVRRRDGITVASWSRLAFDLAADLRPLDHLSVVNQLLDSRRVSAEELVAIERRLGHPARAGSGLFRRTIEQLDPARPQQSHPEVDLGQALRRRGVPVVQQVPVALSDRVLHVDLGIPELRWGIELDLHPEHRSLEGHAADARRRRDMHRRSWQIEVVTEQDMMDVERVADDLATLYHLRRRVHPSAS